MEKDKKQEGRSAIELAILNGIEAYNREQAKKNAGAAAKSEEKQDAKLFGKEAMEEAGLKPKRRSRAKGKGTKLPENKEAESKEKLTTAYAPKLRDNFLRLITKATDGTFCDAIVSADFKTELNVNGETKEVGYFSRGTRDLAEFCLRLALMQTMYGGNPPLLILDDPFVNLDDDNFARATKLLFETASDCQIIYLTCTNRARRLS